MNPFKSPDEIKEFIFEVKRSDHLTETEKIAEEGDMTSASLFQPPIFSN